MTAFNLFNLERVGNASSQNPNHISRASAFPMSSDVTMVFPEKGTSLSLKIIAAGLQEKATGFETIVGGELGRRMRALLSCLGTILVWCDDLGMDEGSFFYDGAVAVLDDSTLVLQLHHNLEADENGSRTICLGNELSRALLAPELNLLGIHNAENDDCEFSAMTFEELMEYGCQCLTYRLLKRSVEIVEAILSQLRSTVDSPKASQMYRLSRVVLLCIRHVLISELFNSEKDEERSASQLISPVRPLTLYCRVGSLLGQPRSTR